MKSKASLLAVLPAAALLSLVAGMPAMAAPAVASARPVQSQLTSAGVSAYLYAVDDVVYLSATGSQTSWPENTVVTLEVSNDNHFRDFDTGIVRSDGTFAGQAMRVGSLGSASEAKAIWRHSFTVSLTAKGMAPMVTVLNTGYPQNIPKLSPYLYTNGDYQLMLSVDGSAGPKTVISGLPVTILITDEEGVKSYSLHGNVRADGTIKMDHDLPVIHGMGYYLYLTVAGGYSSDAVKFRA